MVTATEPSPQGNVASEEVSLAKKLGVREIHEIDADLVDAGRFHLLGKSRGEVRPLPRRLDDLLDERLAQRERIADAE